MTQIKTDATRKTRKALARSVRDGNHKPVLVGDRKAGYKVAVKTGSRVVTLTRPFPYKKLAERWALRKMCRPVLSRTVQG